MTPAETAELLTIVSTFDNRTVQRATAITWSELLADYTFAECAAAVRSHFATSTEYLVPAHVIRAVKAARSVGWVRPEAPAVTGPGGRVRRYGGRPCGRAGCLCSHGDAGDGRVCESGWLTDMRPPQDVQLTIDGDEQGVEDRPRLGDSNGTVSPCRTCFPERYALITTISDRRMWQAKLRDRRAP